MMPVPDVPPIVIVPELCDVPSEMFVVVPDSVKVLEKVVEPEKVCVPLSRANVPSAFGTVSVRVVPVVIPDASNTATLVVSVLSIILNSLSRNEMPPVLVTLVS